MQPVVYLVRDLLFVSKIRAAADQLGVPVTPARDPQALADAARGARLVIVDLRRPDALEALSLLAADPATAALPSVGFIDHERTDVMQEATARGCRTVLAKGKFAADLPRLLATEPAA
jgi:CheY-like chemotaxis protein